MENIFINVNFLEPRQSNPVLSLSERFTVDKDNINESIQDKLNDLFLDGDGVNIINILRSIYRYNNFHFRGSFKNEYNQLIISIDIVDEFNESKIEIIKYKYNQLFDYLSEFINNLLLIRDFCIRVSGKDIYEYKNERLSCEYGLITSYSNVLVDMCKFSIDRIVNSSKINKE